MRIYWRPFRVPETKRLWSATWNFINYKSLFSTFTQFSPWTDQLSTGKLVKTFFPNSLLIIRPSIFQDFLVYTLETDLLHYPLPKPAEAANLLKKETLTIMRCWIEKFGPGYPKLKRLENFLRNSKSLDWDTSQANLLVDHKTFFSFIFFQFRLTENARKMNVFKGKYKREKLPRIYCNYMRTPCPRLNGFEWRQKV